MTTARSPFSRLVRRSGSSDVRILTTLVLVGFVVVMLVVMAPTTVPFTSLMVPLLLGSMLLTPRHTPWFVAYVLVLLVVALSQQEEVTARIGGAAVVQVLMCVIVLVASARRSRLGVGAGQGESMFVDLRDRIIGQGGIPDLPDDWYAASALRSAGGTAFAGDFVVATRPSCDRLEVAVVDVSGKGEQAGIRALQLSGAFGGLLGALPPAGFLQAANDYLLRQDWAEGFATAVHLSVELDTGRFEVRAAGHPPAGLRDGSSGVWRRLPTEGPLLGLVADAFFVCVDGVLGPGDAVLLYTDGMVEEPRLDIDVGIDRLLDEAERLLGADPGAAADPADQLVERLVDRVGSRDDDRAVLLVGRPRSPVRGLGPRPDDVTR